MFGFRVRFVPEKMTGYCGHGAPSIQADQNHKPIKNYTKDKIAAVTDRYARLEDYFTK